jgi:hypothetical protein
MKELLRNISQGRWGPHKAIQQRDFSQGQIRIIPFEDFVRNECQRNNVHPISLYHIAQGQINRDMLQRINRSSIFREKVKRLVCDEWGHCTLSDMFADNVTDPFDYNECGREREASDSIRSQMTGIENSFEQEDPDLLEKLMTLRGECIGCMDRVKGHQTKLGENYEQYQPNFSDVWAELAMKDDSYYHDYEPSRDEKTKKFTEKQVKRVIPEGIKDIFMNASLLPTLMRKENRKMSTEFAGISESLKEDLDKLSYLIKNLPESPEKDETMGFLKGLLEKIKDGWADDSGTDEEEEGDEDKGDVAGEVSTIVGEISHGDEEKNEGSGEDDEGSSEDDDENNDEGVGDDENNDEDAGDDNEGSQAGGARAQGKKNMFHLSFF